MAENEKKHTKQKKDKEKKLEFSYIIAPQQLQDILPHLRKAKELAIDIECENNLHHYGAYTSLIQISTTEKNIVIDILQLKNKIQPIIDIFQDSSIQKVIHDVSFDLRILYDQWKCQMRNIFDTQIAALLLGKEKIGLGSLLEEYFDISKQKKFQRVDWTKRPLSGEMLAYAVKDTAYLLQLKNKLEQELRQKDRLSWVKQECKHLEEVDFSYKKQTHLDISGVKSMMPKERSIFHTLFDLREKLAEEVDKPPFHIFANRQLLSFARNPPFSVNSWKQLRNVHPLVKERAEMFHHAVEKASKREEEYPRKQHKKLAQKEYQFIKQLTELRNNVARKLKIKPHLLLCNDQIRDIVVQKSLSSLRDWQADLIKSNLLIKKITQ